MEKEIIEERYVASPDGKYKIQFNYVLVRKRWKSSVRDVKTYPGVDCGSDRSEYRMALNLS